MEQTLTDKYLNEVVMYGGLPCKRADMIKHARETIDNPDYYLFCFDQNCERIKKSDPELWKYYQSLKPCSFDLLLSMV